MVAHGFESKLISVEPWSPVVPLNNQSPNGTVLFVISLTFTLPSLLVNDGFCRYDFTIPENIHTIIILTFNNSLIIIINLGF